MLESIIYIFAAIGFLAVILAIIGRTSIYKAYATAKEVYSAEKKKSDGG